MLLDDFERYHMGTFAADEAAIGREPLPSSFNTPDGRPWHLKELIIGWRPRISDRWALVCLHACICTDAVRVRHVELPVMYSGGQRKDPAWQFVEEEFGPCEREPGMMLGRADLLTADNMFVEMGTCAPLKFFLNLAHTLSNLMIVPYACPFGFVFTQVGRIFGEVTPGDAMEKFMNPPAETKKKMKRAKRCDRATEIADSAPGEVLADLVGLVATKKKRGTR